DTYALSRGTGKAVVDSGKKTWFFVTADYAFGHTLERDTTEVVLANGGKVLGSVKHPINTQDFSSFMAQAQSSKAEVIGLANAGGDTIGSIKQAAELGIMGSKQTVVPLLMFISDIQALGVYSATMQYLKAIEVTKTDNSDAVMKQMKSVEINDGLFKGRIRADGKFEHDMYLLEVKKPNESKGPNDVAKVVKVIAAKDATLPLAQSKCKYVTK
ncbi:MAG: ABC transporter permease, partial [Burkholderiaceae bacterium]|nr:ABC transporter permease [Burkholderiaceae bacterium]